MHDGALSDVCLWMTTMNVVHKSNKCMMELSLTFFYEWQPWMWFMNRIMELPDVCLWMTTLNAVHESNTIIETALPDEAFRYECE